MTTLRFKSLVLLAALVLGATTQSGNAQSAGALRRVNTVSVVVAMNSYETTPPGIDLHLREMAEASLRAAGLRVLDTSRVEELLDSSRHPVLRITLLALPVKAAGLEAGNAYSLAVQLTEAGRAPTSQADARFELWQSARLNVTSLDLTRAEIERDLRELLEQLVADWRLANRST